MDVAKRLADWRDQPPEQWFTAINRYLPADRHGRARHRHCLSACRRSRGRSCPARRPTVARRLRAPSTTATHRQPTSTLLHGLASVRRSRRASRARRRGSHRCAGHDAEPHAEGHPCERRRHGERPGAIISSNRGEDEDVSSRPNRRRRRRRDAALRLRRPRAAEPQRPARDAAAAEGARSIGSADRAWPSPLPQRRGAQGSLREVISENATRLTDIVRLAPHVQEGQVVGFRVNPGRDRATFEALGLAGRRRRHRHQWHSARRPEPGLASLPVSRRSRRKRTSPCCATAFRKSSSSTRLSCKVSRRIASERLEGAPSGRDSAWPVTAQPALRR